MLQKLYKLGTYVTEDEFARDPLGLNKSYAGSDIVFLCFREADAGWRFEGADLEQFQASRIRQYLFKTRGGNYVSEFPTIDVFKPDFLRHEGRLDLIRSKSGRKLVRIFKKYGKAFKSLLAELESNPEIAPALEAKIGDMSRFALSFKFNGDYPGDAACLQPMIQSLEQTDFNPDYFTYKKKTYEGSGQACALSGRPAERLWGYVSPFAFYAVKTETSAIPGGFAPKNAWKNFPVSPDAARALELGDAFLAEHLSFKLCGYPYFLVPEMILSGDGEDFLEFIRGFKKFSLGEAGEKQVSAEIDLLDALKDQNNSANYNLFFYERNNAEFKILASIDEVFPSRARRIFDAARAAESHAVFRGLPGKNKTLYDQKFDFWILKSFFPDNKREGNFRQSFLGVLRALFMGEPVDAAYVMRRVMHVIHDRFVHDQSTLSPIVKAMLLIKVLKKLQLWREPPHRYRKDAFVMENPYEAFFGEHPDFFDAAVKKAVFLEGVLCQFLLNIQYQEKSATPFRSRLNGMRLKPEIVRRLLPEMIEKLEQYKKNYYRELERTISHYLLRAKFDLSLDDYGFYFVMGMNLAKDFKKKAETEPQGETQS